MLHSILREAWLFVRILLAGVGGLILAGALTLWASVLPLLLGLYLINNVLTPQQIEWGVIVAQGVYVKTVHGVDCHMLFKPCDDWPTREELYTLLDSDTDTLRRLEELTKLLDVVASQSKCAGQSMLDVGYGGIGDIRPVGELLRQLEEESGMDIPCILGNL